MQSLELLNNFKKPWNYNKYFNLDVLSIDSDSSIIIYSSNSNNNLVFIEMFGFDSVYPLFLNKNLFKGILSFDFRFNNSNIFLGLSSPYSRVLIIRGIGFRANIINNSLYYSSECSEVLWDLPEHRYILVRAGHSHVAYLPLPNFLGLRTLRKDRKVVVYSVNKSTSSLFAKIMYNLRPPSVYTGRGIRLKKVRVRRKMGKKDVRKGRFF